MCPLIRLWLCAARTIVYSCTAWRWGKSGTGGAEQQAETDALLANEAEKREATMNDCRRLLDDVTGKMETYTTESTRVAEENNKYGPRGACGFGIMVTRGPSRPL